MVDSSRLMLFHISSIGFRSGLYGGRYTSVIPSIFAVVFTSSDLWVEKLSSIMITWSHTLFFLISNRKLANVSCLLSSVNSTTLWPLKV